MRGERLQPELARDRARGAWLLAVDLANEAEGDPGFVRIFTTPGKVGRGGTAQVSQARRVALYLAATRADVGSRLLAEAADMHRSSVTFAVAAVEDQREDPHFDAKLQELERRLLYRAAAVVMGALGLDLNATQGAG